MKRLIIYFLLALVCNCGYGQYINRDQYTIWTGRMGIGIPSTTIPNTGTHLQLGDSATTRAMWLPRVQTTAAITVPRQGMFVYSISDSSLYYRDLNSWVRIAAAGLPGTVPSWDDVMTVSPDLNNDYISDLNDNAWNLQNVGDFTIHNGAGAFTRLKISVDETNLFAPDGVTGFVVTNDTIFIRGATQTDISSEGQPVVWNNAEYFQFYAKTSDGVSSGNGGFFELTQSSGVIGAHVNSDLRTTQIGWNAEADSLTQVNLIASSENRDDQIIVGFNQNSIPKRGISLFSGGDSISIEYGWGPPSTSSLTGYALQARNTTSGALVDFTGSVGSNLVFEESLVEVNDTVTLVNDSDIDSTYYGNLGGKGWKDAAIIDLSGATPGMIPIYQGGQLFELGTVSVTPAGGNMNLQFYRNGAFTAAASDSLNWTTTGLNIKGRYHIDGLPVIFQPDQSGSAFLNTIFYGSLPASITHGSGIQAQYVTAVGKNALTALTTGASIVAVGSRAMQANTTGNNNVGVGDGALITNTSGSNNTAVGMAAAPVNSTASNITAIGFESLRMTTAGNNTGLGYRSLHENTSGANNVGLGPDAGYQNLTGSFNTWVGSSAGTGAGGSSNSNNTGIGYQVGFGNSTGSNNIFIGYRAGDNNTTESNKIVIGYDVDAPSGSNTATIGNFLFATGVTGTGTTPAGNVGIGITSTNITARLHLPAQTTAASSAPLKLGSGASGTVMTTPEAGAFEYDDVNLFFTSSVGVRGYVIPSLVQTSSAGTLSLGVGYSDYFYNGSGGATWSLPAVTGTTGQAITVSNIGSGNLTVDVTGGGSTIFSTSAVASVVLAVGDVVTFKSNSTYWKVQ